MKLKIVFIGTPEFASIILEKLIKEKLRPVLVITAPDKPSGRKNMIHFSPIKLTAQKHNITILQPKKISDAKNELLKIKPDIIIVNAYKQKLPKEILDIPKYGCLNIHPSLLPRWYGTTPIQYAILSGDKETGVTIILMNEKFDAGSIISQESIKIEDKETNPSLQNKLAILGANLLIKTIPGYIEERIIPKTQDSKNKTMSKILKKEDGKINWSKPAIEIERQIRAFNPWPSSFCNFNNKILKIWEASIDKEKKAQDNKSIGEVFLKENNEICIQCKENYLIIKKLQLEGSNLMNSQDFLRGHKDFIGNILR